MQDSELTKRETFLKNTLSKELDIEIIKDEKTILEKYSLNNEVYLNTYNCNALQGKFEEYEYCICEYCYTVGKSSQKRWMVSSSA